MLVGRKKELTLLKTIMQDNKSHFIAVYGRRRIGKTFLIREAFNYTFTFQHAGLSSGSISNQLFAFASSLKSSGCNLKKIPESWLEAFENLKNFIKQSREKRKVIFIDELSWMDTPRANLLAALENFWNSFASARNDIIFIVCASATSWMLSRIVHNKGGLYNRLTDQINLQSFSLKECEDFVGAMELKLTRYQILQYYMIFGGVPFYWTFLKKGFSLFQNIDNILFAGDAPLKDEFKYLYASIFKNPSEYIQIIEALGTKKVGMTREEIIKEAKVENSGALTAKLEELENCGFIRRYYAFGMKKKNALYQLMDNFTLFYFKFLQEKPTDEHFWTNQINTPRINTWMGFAFERVCMQHVTAIKSCLGISGVLTDVNSWYCKSNNDIGIFGSQIDLLIARKDQIINLCEIKYCDSEFAVTEKTERAIREKISDFKTLSKTKYAIHSTLVTTYGLITNAYSSIFQSIITLDDLFQG